jgi:hypothetical protein
MAVLRELLKVELLALRMVGRRAVSTGEPKVEQLGEKMVELRADSMVCSSVGSWEMLMETSSVVSKGVSTAD